MAEMPRRLPRSWGLAALVAVAVAVLAVTVLDLLLVGHGPVPAAWRTLLVGGAVDVAVLLAGGAIAGMAMPKLLRFGRRAVRGIGGMTYRTATPSNEPTAADPARGRPA